MKTYEEMAQSVISRAKAHKTARNRLIAGSVAAVLALGLCVGVTVMNRPAEEPTLQTPVVTLEPTLQTSPSDMEDSQTVVHVEPNGGSLLQTLPSADTAKHRVTFLYAEGENTTKMEQGMVLPLKSQLRVQDVTGMTDDEIDAVAKAEQEYADNLIAGYPDSAGYGWSQFNPTHGTDEKEHLVITYIHAGDVILKTDDISQIESIRATTKNSTLILPAFASQQWEAVADDPEAGYDFHNRYPMTQDYIITGESLQQWYWIPYGGIQINLILGNGVEKYLNENSVPLSQLSETLTFTVTYVDGTVETHTTDMIFNDNGEIYALYQGATAVA